MGLEARSVGATRRLLLAPVNRSYLGVDDFEAGTGQAGGVDGGSHEGECFSGLKSSDELSAYGQIRTYCYGYQATALDAASVDQSPDESGGVGAGVERLVTESV